MTASKSKSIFRQEAIQSYHRQKLESVSIKFAPTWISQMTLIISFSLVLIIFAVANIPVDIRVDAQVDIAANNQATLIIPAAYTADIAPDRAITILMNSGNVLEATVIDIIDNADGKISLIIQHSGALTANTYPVVIGSRCILDLILSENKVFC